MVRNKMNNQEIKKISKFTNSMLFKVSKSELI